MKTKFICVIAIAIVTAVNVKFAFNSDNPIIKLSLENIMALASGESPICSRCGGYAEGCSCEFGITCSHGDCHGKQCHHDQGNWVCPCVANGNPLSHCLL